MFDILGGKIQFSQNILKSWSNVQKNYKNIFHHRGGGGGGPPRDGKSHHVFTFFKMNPSLSFFYFFYFHNSNTLKYLVESAMIVIMNVALK